MNSLAEMSLSRNVGGVCVDTNMGQGVRWTIIWSPSSMRVYALPRNCKSSISIVGRTTLGSDHYHFIETCPYSGAPTNTQTVSIWDFLLPPAAKIQGTRLTPCTRCSESRVNDSIMKIEPLFLLVKCDGFFVLFVLFCSGWVTNFHSQGGRSKEENKFTMWF